MHLYDRAASWSPWFPERVFHDGDGGEGGGGSGGGEGEGSGGEGAGEARTFSQADLDRIVQDRVARERKKYEGFDELKTKAEEYDKFQEAQKSELEKAQARADKLAKELADAQAAAEQTSLRSSLLAEAAKAERKIVDPQAAVDLLVSIDADLLDGDDSAKALDALLEKRPYLVAAEEKARPGGADQGARGGGKNQLPLDALKGMSPEEIDKAHREGRFDDALKGGR